MDESGRVFVIRGKYSGCPWENIDIFDNRADAEKALSEYRMAYGPEWSLIIKSHIVDSRWQAGKRRH